MTRETSLSTPLPLTDRAVMVRSLRRRLWKALQEEDIETAIRAYNATRQDYLDWLEEEQAEEERKRKIQEEAREKALQERREARPAALRRLGSMMMKKPKKKRDERKGTVNLELEPLTEQDRKARVLQCEFGASSFFEPDDYKSPRDPFHEITEPKPDPPPQPQKTRRGPRLAGFLFRTNAAQTAWNLENELRKRKEEEEEEGKIDETLTTPLHEAGRLGSPELVRLFLDSGGNPNLKNGLMRTTLHMVAGGLSKREAETIASEREDNEDIGIQMPNMDIPSSSGAADENRGKPFRLFRKSTRKHIELEEPVAETAPASDEHVSSQTVQRTDTLLTILAWTHPQDGTSAAGDGPSLNAVDSVGRTALHYASELGRTHICLYILQTFGILLTIVDESGQTPCELAARQGYPDLAAQLEARAILHSDPYGMDEELLASVFDEKEEKTGREALVPPFSWFETWNMEKANKERQGRVESLLQQIKEMLHNQQEKQDAMDSIYNQEVANALMEDSPQQPQQQSKDEQQQNAEEEDSKPPAVEEDRKMAAVVQDDGALTGSNQEDSTKQEVGMLDVDPAQTTKTEVVDDDGNTGNTPQPAEEPDPQQEDDQKLPAESGLNDLDAAGPVPPNDASADADQSEEATIQEEPTSKEAPFGGDRVVQQPTSEVQILLDGLHLGHAEKILVHHGWDLAKATKSFQNKDLVEALKDLKIVVNKEQQQEQEESKAPNEENDDMAMCLICCDEFDKNSKDWTRLESCGHGFCTECLGDYISECARTKETGLTIDCPHHECNIPLSSADVEKLAPDEETYASLVSAATDNFIAQAEDVTFCPHPGCVGVVHCPQSDFFRLHDLDHDLTFLTGAVCTATGSDPVTSVEESTLTYEGVYDLNFTATRASAQPCSAHRFCFVCGGKAHWPVSCEVLEQWKEKIQEEVEGLEETEGSDKNNDFNDVAQKLWIKANTRPCPKCKAPIEKNDGCNHMTCTNRTCRHEFCWICREDWKLHNTETGGFFRCNRWQDDEKHQYYDTPPPNDERIAVSAQDSSPNDDQYGTALHSSQSAWKKSKEMGRFLHHYQRWNAHSDSAALEHKMSSVVAQRMVPVVEAAIDYNGNDAFDFGGKGLSFVHAAFTELLECRSVLQHSYAFAFFRYPTFMDRRRDRSRSTKNLKREQQQFEQLQSELEMMTEQMSDVVARHHIRASQMQIRYLTKGTCNKRTDLLLFMLSVMRDQRKEAERAEMEQKKPPVVDRFSLGSAYGASSGMFPHSRREVLPHPRRHLLHGFTDSDDDSDDDHFLGIGGLGGLRWARTNDDPMEEALRLSLQAHRRTRHNDYYGGGGDAEPRWENWDCSVCTYMNSTGHRCAMCGSSRV